MVKDIGADRAILLEELQRDAAQQGRRRVGGVALDRHCLADAERTDQGHHATGRRMVEC